MELFISVWGLIPCLLLYNKLQKLVACERAFFSWFCWLAGWFFCWSCQDSHCGYVHLVGFLEDALSGDSVMTGCLSLWTVVLSFYMIPDPHGGYPGLLTWQLGSKSTCSREWTLIEPLLPSCFAHGLLSKENHVSVLDQHGGSGGATAIKQEGVIR